MSKRDKLRIAFVGAGSIACNIHLPALSSFEDVEFVGLCDLNAKRLQSAADQFGITNCFDDAQKMVDATHPDGIYVIAWPQYVYDLWVWCLQQGLNLYIEKPMGLTMHQADTLAYLARKHQCITQVGFQRRCAPLLVEMRRRCIEKGPILHATCEFFKCSPGPYPQAAGHWLDDGTHAVDTVRWLCGGEIVAVESHCKRINSPDINWASATLHFDNGATGLVLCSFCSGRRVFRVQMHSSEICAEGDPEGNGRIYADNNSDGTRITTQQAAGKDDRIDFVGFRAKHRQFIDSIKSGREQTGSPFHDAVKTMEVIHTVLAQDQIARGEASKHS